MLEQVSPVPKRSASVTAFTLVELLVVIGIIALLISILLPTISAVRRQAGQAKCAAHLQQIGNAVLLYGIDNRGYMVPWRAGYTTEDFAAHPTAVYELGGVRFSSTDPAPKGTPDPAYWFNFLSKYLTKMAGGTASGGAAAQSDYQKTVAWGCAAWDPYPVASAKVSSSSGLSNGAEWAMNFTGIGFNPHPTFRPDYPSTALNTTDPGLNATRRPPETYRTNNSIKGTYPGSTKTTFIGVATSNNWATIQGRWFKVSDYTNPAGRALCGDSIGRVLEANTVIPGAKIPAQKTHWADPEFWNDSGSWASTGTGQTTFDWYRHGKPPQVEGGTAGDSQHYADRGGKIAYNVLYCDGHVQGETTREASYRALRQRFPG